MVGLQLYLGDHDDSLRGLLLSVFRVQVSGSLKVVCKARLNHVQEYQDAFVWTVPVRRTP